MNTSRPGIDRQTNPQEVSASDPTTDTSPTLLERLHNALGPLAAGIIIDVVDFAMFGPIGLVLGPFVGGLAGWWVSSIYGFGTRGRLIVAALAAIYVTMPFTELLPLATMVAAVGRFYHAPSAGKLEDREAPHQAEGELTQPDPRDESP